MKITSVDVILVTLGRAATESSPWNPTIIRIHTDMGISGYGEMGLTYGRAKNAAYGMAQDFGRLILGMDPMDNEKIWDKLHRSTFWGLGNGGIVMSAISAIDIALWDIKGKALGVPCYQLLGGKTNQKLRAYASQIQFDWGKESRCLVRPEEYAEAALKAIADGYDAVKVDPVGFDSRGVWYGHKTYGIMDQKHLRLSVDRLAAVREAVGPDVDIIVELHAKTDANSAIPFARAIEPFHCFYYEEPTSPMNDGNMDLISKSIRLPVASGERIYTRWGYRPFFEKHALQVIQPDLGNTGGLTEGKKICDMAHIYDIPVQMHICGGPIATAAALQLEAAIPNYLIHEHHAAALLDENIRSCKYDYQPVNGYFDVPDLPGIGQELSDEALETAEITTLC